MVACGSQLKTPFLEKPPESDFILIAQFYLLRKCGLLAHTLAAFLKNCCIEKLFRIVQRFSEKYFVVTVPPEQLQNTCLLLRFTRRGGLVRPASKSSRFSHHPLRVPKAWHGNFAACGQRSGLLALNLANIFEKLLDQKTFCLPTACLRKTN